MGRDADNDKLATVGMVFKRMSPKTLVCFFSTHFKVLISVSSIFLYHCYIVFIQSHWPRSALGFRDLKGLAL